MMRLLVFLSMTMLLACSRPAVDVAAAGDEAAVPHVERRVQHGDASSSTAASAGYTVDRVGGYRFDSYARPEGYYAHPSFLGVRIGDATGDGRSDVVAFVTEMPGSAIDRVWILAQQPGGTLAAPLEYAVPMSYQLGSFMGLALGDLNRDGRDDVIVAKARMLYVVMSDRAGGSRLLEFSAPPLPIDSVPLVADFDRDGRLDVAVHVSKYATERPADFQSRLIVHYGDGDGGIRRTVAQVTGVVSPYDLHAAQALDLGDFNADGWIDVAAAFDEGDFEAQRQRKTVTVLLNRAGELQAPVLVHQNNFLTFLAAGDVNGDGLDDIVANDSLIAPPGSRMWIYRQLPAGGLSGDPTSMPSKEYVAAMRVGDIDLDGYEDLIAANSGWGSFSIQLQRQGLLEPPTIVPIPRGGAGVGGNGPSSLAAGDFNGDGCTDIAATQTFDGLWLYHGRGCAPRTAIMSTPLPPLREE